MFVDTFIKRPILATVCSLVIILAGAIAIPTLPVAQYPEIAPPQVSVTAFYTGANAEAVETGVTTPLEQAINGVEGMLYMTSSSSNSGVSNINIAFDTTRDADVAAVDVQNRVSQALGRLPGEVRQTGITVQKQSTNFVLGAGVYAAKGEYDSLFLSNYIDVSVKDALKRVPGVADVIIFGERKYSMRLWLDPSRLAARQLTAGDVVNALREQNVQVAAGSVGDSPARAGQTYQISVRAAGRLREVADFENLILEAGKGGALVRLRDVGTAELGAETYATTLRFQGFDAVGFGVMQLPSANALDVERGVVEELNRLSRTFPPGLEYRIAFNTTRVVAASIEEVLWTLAEAIGLVVIVMFVFLQSWRSTLIPTLTMPVSLIGTFAFVKLFGFSINTLTLFGIVLSTGIVVDDAIVVIENIERHIAEHGRTAREAAVEAMREVLGAVIATALVLIAVFVPVAFFPGTTGRLYQQFSLTIAVAVAISAFNALTLTPALSALLLKGGAGHGKHRVFALFERVIAGGTRMYVGLLGRLARVRWAVVVLFIAGLGLTYVVYRWVPRSFVPQEDQGYLMTLVQAPAGASLDYTNRLASEAEKILMAVPEVEGVFSVMGFSFSGAASNQGLIFSSLKPFDERQGEDQTLDAVLNRIRVPLFGLGGGMVVSFPPPSIQGLGAFGGFTFEVLDATGGDITGLATATQALIGEASKSPKLANLFTTFTANDPQLAVDIDRDRARSLGLPISEVTSALQIYLGSTYVNDFDFNNRAYRVYVQADKAFRSDPKDLGQYYARTSRGDMVPLSAVVRVRETTAPQVISHFNLFRSAEINGAAAPGFSSGEAIQEMEQIATRTLPAGMRFEWSGISLEEIKAGTQSTAIFAIGLLLVYLTLAAQYESLVLPFIILLGVPLAVLGALTAQGLRGLENDVYCQIGLVMLIGLAAKNSILIVEFAEQLRERGMSVVDAAIEAARIRLRPILMTSLAFILGVMPLVFASGAGQEGRHSVGTAVAGGMFFATFLNIIFIPILYIVVQTLRGGARRTAAQTVAVVVALVAGSATASAQTPAGDASMPRVTFEEAVRRAVENHPSVAQAATGILRAEAVLQQTKAQTRTTLDGTLVSTAAHPRTEFGGVFLTPLIQTRGALALSVPLITPVASAQRTQAADRVQVARLGVEEAKRSIAVAAAQAYLTVITQRRVLELNERARDTARSHAEYARERFEGGLGSRLNQIRAQQEVSSDEVRMEAARLALRRAQEALGVLMAADTPVDAAGEPALTSPAGAADADALKQRADLQLMASREAAAERVVADSWRDNLPTVSGLFAPQVLGPPGLFGTKGSVVAQVLFAVPLFDGGRRKGVARERQSQLDLVRVERTGLEREARAEVRAAREAVVSSERGVVAARSAAEQAAEVVRITDVAYRAGATTNLELIDAQRRARDAETEAAIAEDSLRRARLELLSAIGRFPQ